jgi:hypothetical protein
MNSATPKRTRRGGKTLTSSQLPPSSQIQPSQLQSSQMQFSQMQPLQMQFSQIQPSQMQFSQPTQIQPTQMAFSSEIIPLPGYTRSQPAPPGFTQYSQLPPPPIDPQEAFMQPRKEQKQGQLPPTASQESQVTRQLNKERRQEQTEQPESQGSRSKQSNKERRQEPGPAESQGSQATRQSNRERRREQPESQESQITSQANRERLQQNTPPNTRPAKASINVDISHSGGKRLFIHQDEPRTRNAGSHQRDRQSSALPVTDQVIGKLISLAQKPPSKSRSNRRRSPSASISTCKRRRHWLRSSYTIGSITSLASTRMRTSSLRIRCSLPSI